MENNSFKVRRYVKYSDRTLKKAIQGMVLSSYGVAGLAHHDLYKIDTKKVIRSGVNDSIILKKNSKGSYIVSIYVFLSSSVKISEVLSEIQKRITYELRKAYGVKLTSVNVYAQGIDNGN